MHAGLLGAQLRDDDDDAALMLGCFCISDLLFLIVPSLCVLLQPLAQSDSTFLMRGRALRWGGVAVSPSVLKCGGGELSCRGRHARGLLLIRQLQTRVQ